MRYTRQDSDTRNLLAAVAREQLARAQPISARALAALASVSEDHVLRLIESGALQARQLAGGEHRIDAAEVMRWLAEASSSAPR
jgi:excisionase family DNA binding protein